jgi:hypothetical protein
MPTDRLLILAAFVSFCIAVLQLPVRINLVALGLALWTLALYLTPGR